ncbi:hypothetical protein SBA5_1080010 [Candidatus Sulfotelmatomonas gaucii]|uniref:Uncharacterized protein n=1 Tax=Candidatus Sulfuritelmatomonas gaucii TaxID=2043161 RepID=A0A2N9L345_9BACT|nr:hypothetical protein SBA5_1080010 [Candidatus Sulfotelmatomonas gaucii]
MRKFFVGHRLLNYVYRAPMMDGVIAGVVLDGGTREPLSTPRVSLTQWGVLGEAISGFSPGYLPKLLLDAQPFRSL